MSAKQRQQVRAGSQDRTRLHSWLQSIRQAPIHAWAIAVALGLGLALCEADLLVPLFWERRLPIQLGMLFTATVLQTPLLLGGVRGFFLGKDPDAGPVGLLAHWTIGLGLGGSLLALARMVGNHFQAAAQASALGQVAATSNAVLDGHVEFTYLVLLFALFALPATRPLLDALTPHQRMRWPLYVLGAGLALTYLVNSLLPMLDLSVGTFVAPKVVPTYYPVGMDFRRGLYLPAARLLSGESIYPADAAKSPNVYPPFVTLMGTAYVPLGEERALLLHVLLLFAANIICLVMAVMLWRRIGHRGETEADGEPALVDLVLLIFVGASLFTGYPFLFSLERGNIDALAMLLAVAGYLVLVVRPERIWWQMALVSLAIHIKVYPILLLLPMFLAHRRRMILPTLLVNVVLLLCLGPANAVGFLLSVFRFYHHNAFAWIGNHSAYSYAGMLLQSIDVTGKAELLLIAVLAGLPLALWGFGMRAAVRSHVGGRIAAAGLVLTTPVMAVLPGISYDYQLVILSAPILLLLAMILESMQKRQSPADYLQLLLVVLVAGMVGRSYLIMPGVSPLIQNKYPWLILLEVVALVQVLRDVWQPEVGPAFRPRQRASVGK